MVVNRYTTREPSQVCARSARVKAHCSFYQSIFARRTGTVEKINHKNLFYYNKYCEIYFNHKIHLKFLSEFSGAQMKTRLFVFVAMAAAEAHLFTRINASARKDNKNEILYSDYV